MKRISGFLCAMLLVFGFMGRANAALWDRGGGLIYDDVLKITWLQDANYGAGSSYDDGSSLDGKMTWNNAVAWAENLSYYDSVRDVYWDDWRLPQTLPVDGSNHYDYNYDYDGSADRGYNISAPGSAYPGSTGSEMAYMYYNNLGNLGHYDINGDIQPGWGLQNTGPFDHLWANYYWSGTECSAHGYDAWVFRPYFGEQEVINYSYYGHHAWAVRPGDVVPIPGTMLLLSSGLIGLVGFRRKFRK